MASDDETIVKLQTWTLTLGAALNPPGADTYSEGMHDAKEQVLREVVAHPYIVEPSERGDA